MKKLLAVIAAGMLMVSGMAFAQDAAKEEKKAAETVKGYLSDQLVGKAGKDAAGNDLTATPEKVTVEAMKAEENAKSGYGVFVLDEATQKYVFLAFDAKGTELATSEVLAKTQKTEGVYVEVTGAVDKEKSEIAVEAIKEVEKDAKAAEGSKAEEKTETKAEEKAEGK